MLPIPHRADPNVFLERQSLQLITSDRSLDDSAGRAAAVRHVNWNTAEHPRSGLGVLADRRNPPGAFRRSPYALGVSVLKLLERNILSIERRLVLVAPPGIDIPGAFTNVMFDTERHTELV